MTVENNIPRIHTSRRSDRWIKNVIKTKAYEYAIAGYRMDIIVKPALSLYLPQESERDIKLFTLFGWAAISVDEGGWDILHAMPRSDYDIAEKQLYELQIGENGWGCVRGISSLAVGAAAIVDHR